jgi:hypothetical protein
VNIRGLALVQCGNVKVGMRPSIGQVALSSRRNSDAVGCAVKITRAVVLTFRSLARHVFHRNVRTKTALESESCQCSLVSNARMRDRGKGIRALETKLNTGRFIAVFFAHD